MLVGDRRGYARRLDGRAHSSAFRALADRSAFRPDGKRPDWHMLLYPYSYV